MKEDFWPQGVLLESIKAIVLFSQLFQEVVEVEDVSGGFLTIVDHQRHLLPKKKKKYSSNNMLTS